MDNPTQIPKETKFYPLIIIMIIVIMIWGVFWYFLYPLPNEQRGTFGDMFGAVNALFAGLAFAGVIFAILLQRKELELQRKELELTRDELRGQKEQLQEQNKTLQKQNFENTFFQMLRLHNEIVSSIDLAKADGSRITSGRDCIAVFYRRFKKYYENFSKNNTGMPPDKLAIEAYNEFSTSIQNEIGHYFRYLYNIIKFVKNSDIVNKQFYTNLVRAQLSDAELSLLFYNCVSKRGSNKFKPLVEEFALLNNLPLNDLINPSEHKTLFINSAYENNTE